MSAGLDARVREAFGTPTRNKRSGGRFRSRLRPRLRRAGPPVV